MDFSVSHLNLDLSTSELVIFSSKDSSSWSMALFHKHDEISLPCRHLTLVLCQGQFSAVSSLLACRLLVGLWLDFFGLAPVSLTPDLIYPWCQFQVLP